MVERQANQPLRIAVLVERGFEQVELIEPCNAMRQAGMQPVIVSPAGPKVRGWDFENWGEEIDVDLPLDRANPEDFDGLLLPGGVMNPDKLRLNRQAVDFVRRMYESGKPIAAICHAPWMLIEADVVDGRRLTSYPSLRTDLENAGAEWVDEECVVDDGLVTSRSPKDIPAFNRKMVKEFAEGMHAARR